MATELELLRELEKYARRGHGAKHGCTEAYCSACITLKSLDALRSHYIEADVPLPAPATVEGTVVGGEGENGGD
jgi:hypothetical protein